MDDATARALLRRVFDAGLRAADPRAVLAAHLPDPPDPPGRVLVLGAGKASALMAAALEEAWPHVPLTGLVVTRHGHAVPTTRVEVVEAAHPVPDAASEAAARRTLALARDFAPTLRDLVLFLVSGGGSALLVAPAPGLALDDKRALNRALLASGADIGRMNAARKHLSAIKGGRLAAALHPARVVTLAISDVPGDGPGVIASGPTVPDPTTLDDARDTLRALDLPPDLRARLDAALSETPKPGDPRLAGAEFRLVATPMMALRAAADAARAEGLTPLILGDALEGEAREVGAALAGVARSVAAHGEPLPAPALLLSGGETTVTLRHPAPGRGGRNTEALLGFALAHADRPGTWALMADTDGVDGAEEAAGAITTPTTLARARAAGLDPREALARHDAAGLFAALGDLLVTGPTLTNVNDLRLVLVARADDRTP